MDAIIRKPGILKITNQSPSGLERNVRNGHFPRPIKIGDRAVGWLASEVEEWLKRRAAERDQPLAETKEETKEVA